MSGGFFLSPGSQLSMKVTSSSSLQPGAPRWTRGVATRFLLETRESPRRVLRWWEDTQYTHVHTYKCFRSHTSPQNTFIHTYTFTNHPHTRTLTVLIWYFDTRLLCYLSVEHIQINSFTSLITDEDTPLIYIYNPRFLLNATFSVLRIWITFH